MTRCGRTRPGQCIGKSRRRLRVLGDSAGPRRRLYRAAALRLTVLAALAEPVAGLSIAVDAAGVADLFGMDLDLEHAGRTPRSPRRRRRKDAAVALEPGGRGRVWSKRAERAGAALATSSPRLEHV